jgi:hypothetical protein
MMTDEELAALGYGGANAAGGRGPGTTPAAGGAGTGEGGAFDFSGMINAPSQAMAAIAWQRSVTASARESRLTGRPLLVYFTHHDSIPSQQMEASLMNNPEFVTLVKESCVPLLVDFSDQDTARSELYRGLKSRLEVSGYPALVLTQPDGTEVTRLTGYKRDSERRYLELLRGGIQRAGKLAAERRTRLEKEGYRNWTSKDGNPVFARLVSLDANMGVFTGEWGETFKTFLSRLSEADQAWIAERRRPAM